MTENNDVQADASLADGEWPLRTERLVLRPATERDAEAVFAYRSRADVARWLPSWPCGIGAFRAQWASMVPHHLVFEREETLIGDLKCELQASWADKESARPVPPTAEIGWVLAPDWQGKGYAREAVAALLAVAFERLGARRTVAYCYADNAPSWQLMERLGMRRECHAVQDSLHRDGNWHDSYCYALLRGEWREMHAS